MAVQDDARENHLRELFRLEKEEGEGRGGNDAILKMDGAVFKFELKSSSDKNRSVTTVRDFGLEHVANWKGKHWLIGFYDATGKNLEYCLYGSPDMMDAWVQEKANYIGPDLLLARIAPDHLKLDDMRTVCGVKEMYALADAKRIQKQQYSAAEYKAKMDVKDGYSPDRMLEIVKDRAHYLILRGSTLNNPHIPGSYFNGWTKITENHAETLRKMVLEAIAKPDELPQ